MTVTRILLAAALVLTLAACRREAETSAGGTAATGSRPAGTSTAPVGTEVGSTLPEYTAAWLDGSRFDLADRRGRAVLLNLWATWCPPCRAEIPELQRLHERYAPSGFEVVGVSVDEGGVETVRQFVTERKVTYPIILDPEGKLASILQTSVLPTTLLLDRQGKIVWKHYGAIRANDQDLQKAIEIAVKPE